MSFEAIQKAIQPQHCGQLLNCGQAEVFGEDWLVCDKGATPRLAFTYRHSPIPAIFAGYSTLVPVGLRYRLSPAATHIQKV